MVEWPCCREQDRFRRRRARLGGCGAARAKRIPQFLWAAGAPRSHFAWDTVRPAGGAVPHGRVLNIQVR
jgi:hypothetical protein